MSATAINDVEDGLEQLGALVAALADVDPGVLDDVALHDVTIGLQRLHGRLGVVAGQALAVWEARGVWASDQSRTSAGRLSRELNCSSRTAKTSVRRARQLVDVPETVAAVHAGVLSPDHIGLLAGARAVAPDAFVADEATLVGHCAALRYPDAERIVAYWKLHVDPDSAAADAADREAEASSADCSETFDGTVVLDASFDPVTGITFHRELRRLAEQIRSADQRDGVTRTTSQRLAAALVEMAVRSASTPAGAQRPRPLFTALVGDDTLTRLCELANGRVVSPTALIRYVDTALLETILFDGPSTVVAVSHKRSFTGALRRAIEVRDRHCQHPSGCDIPADRCDVDHIIPWPESQRTDQHNGRLECPTHNRHAHLHDTDAAARPVQHLTGHDVRRAHAHWWSTHHHRTNPDPDDSDPDPDPDPDAGIVDEDQRRHGSVVHG